MMDDWQSDITDFTIIDIEKMKFILQECKLHLQYTYDASKELDNKCIIIISVMFTVLTALIGFSFSQFGIFNIHKIPIITALSYFVVYYAKSITCLVKATDPIAYSPPGNSAENLLTKETCTQDLVDIIFCEIQSYPCRVDKNKLSNKIKSEYYSKALKSLINIPIYSLMIYFLFQLLLNYKYISSLTTTFFHF